MSISKTSVRDNTVLKTENAVVWTAWGETDQGRKRDNNEDRILFEADRGIFGVVDGMGGEAAGEVAAQQAVDFIRARLSQGTGTVARRLREAIAGANNEIFSLAEQNPEWRGMACVLTVAVIEDGVLHVGHVGDSRLYAIRNGEIKKITSDHSPVGQKEDAGELTEAEAMKHPRRNEVFRDVGSQPHKPDDADFIQYLQVPFTRDAAFVLCSDGLSDMLSSREIMEVVADGAGDPRVSARRLIERANSAGGADNISVIVIEGDAFALSAKKKRIPLPSSPLAGRWAFLLYGLVLGILAGFLWQRSHDGGVEPPLEPSIRKPVVLKVDPGSQYPTIASALAAALPGDRIELADGRYEEFITLKEGIEIAARTPGKAILRVAHVFPDVEAAISGHGISGARISGIMIDAEPAAGLPFGIKIHDSDVEISNVEVSGAVNGGILFDGKSTGYVGASYLHRNAGPGLVVSGSSRPRVTGNLLYANGKSGVRRLPGMYITGDSEPEVKRNVFSGNGAEPIRIQRPELSDRMNDNLFLNSATRKPVLVEKGAR